MRTLLLLALLCGAETKLAAREGGKRSGRAGEPSELTQKLAKAAFANAERLFRERKYEEAKAEYLAAYEVWPLDGFLFNIAQCERNLGHLPDAIEYFERYLKSDRADRNRAEVIEVVAELRRQLQEATPAYPRTTALAPPPPAPSHASAPARAPISSRPSAAPAR
jgi:tetratricopeptide (TPR) repeat protein